MIKSGNRDPLKARHDMGGAREYREEGIRDEVRSRFGRGFF